MADKIDKALTQEPRKELNIPGQEEIQESVEQEVDVYRCEGEEEMGQVLLLRNTCVLS